METDNIIVTDTIYERFWKEFWAQTKDYVEFIHSKDLGIEAIHTERLATRCYNSNTYKIINEHRWLLSKIRYGI